jgi:hypothetical protein
MAFELGKTDISTITGKVDIMQPGDNGTKRKVATLKVTTEVLTRSEFIELTQQAGGDREVAKRLVKNIEAGDSTTQVAPYTPELMDDIFEIDWQFAPIFDFVLGANNERIGRALRAKN